MRFKEVFVQRSQLERFLVYQTNTKTRRELQFKKLENSSINRLSKKSSQELKIERTIVFTVTSLS